MLVDCGQCIEHDTRLALFSVDRRRHLCADISASGKSDHGKNQIFHAGPTWPIRISAAHSRCGLAPEPANRIWLDPEVQK